MIFEPWRVEFMALAIATTASLCGSNGTRVQGRPTRIAPHSLSLNRLQTEAAARGTAFAREFTTFARERFAAAGPMAADLPATGERRAAGFRCAAGSVLRSSSLCVG